MYSFRSSRHPALPPLLLALATAGELLDAAPALAATIHVTTIVPEPESDGECSLVEAIQAAQTNAPVDSCESGGGLSDTIDIPAGTYEIFEPASPGLGLPAISTTVVLQGAGSAQTIIKRAANAPLFGLLNIGTASTLKGLTLSGGRTAPGAAGSTIVGQVATPLTLEDVVISGSRGGPAWWPAVGKVTNCRFVDNEGVIESRFDNASQLSITDSVFEDNVANARGALILVGPATIKNSIFRRNGALTASGGAISAMGTISILDSLFEGNQANQYGGAVNSTGTLEISGTTFVANAAGYGGAVSLDGGKLVNSTFSGNEATVYGGAVEVREGTTTTLNNVTIADNECQQHGGGLAKAGGSALLISNSVIAGNASADGPDCYAHNGAVISSVGHNFIGLGTACGLAAATGDEIGTGSPLEPQLSALGDHGGTTPTQAPFAGSPLIDGGYPGSGSGKPCETTDQAGTPRPVGARCDIGAFEGELDGGGGDGAGGEGSGGNSDGDSGGAANGGEGTGSGDAGAGALPGAGGEDGSTQGGSDRGGRGGTTGGGAAGDNAAGDSSGGSRSGSKGSGSESSSGGCGCRIAGRFGQPGAALALLVAGLALGVRRRRAA
jgi:MYXO-CTERM domain-containing protein